MSLVASRLSLTHQCTIQRNANATPSAWNTPGAPDWQPLATNVPCRAWTTTGREVVDATTIVVVEDMRMLLTADTDVTERDQIGDITDRAGTIISGPLDISAVVRQRDFIELLLVRVA